MSGPLDIWRQAAATWSKVYGQVTESQWERPTPCEEWTVRQLVDHTLNWQAEGGRLIGDLLIHSWDLARSIGADEALPPDAVEAITIGLHHVPPDLLRGTNPL